MAIEADLIQAYLSGKKGQVYAFPFDPERERSLGYAGLQQFGKAPDELCATLRLESTLEDAYAADDLELELFETDIETGDRAGREVSLAKYRGAFRKAQGKWTYTPSPPSAAPADATASSKPCFRWRPPGAEKYFVVPLDEATFGAEGASYEIGFRINVVGLRTARTFPEPGKKLYSVKVVPVGDPAVFTVKKWNATLKPAGATKTLIAFPRKKDKDIWDGSSRPVLGNLGDNEYALLSVRPEPAPASGKVRNVFLEFFERDAGGETSHREPLVAYDCEIVKNGAEWTVEPLRVDYRGDTDFRFEEGKSVVLRWSWNKRHYLVIPFNPDRVGRLGPTGEEGWTFEVGFALSIGAAAVDKEARGKWIPVEVKGEQEDLDREYEPAWNVYETALKLHQETLIKVQEEALNTFTLQDDDPGHKPKPAPPPESKHGLLGFLETAFDALGTVLPLFKAVPVVMKLGKNAVKYADKVQKGVDIAEKAIEGGKKVVEFLIDAGDFFQEKHPGREPWVRKSLAAFAGEMRDQFSEMRNRNTEARKALKAASDENWKKLGPNGKKDFLVDLDQRTKNCNQYQYPKHRTLLAEIVRTYLLANTWRIYTWDPGTTRTSGLWKGQPAAHSHVAATSEAHARHLAYLLRDRLDCVHPNLGHLFVSRAKHNEYKLHGLHISGELSAGNDYQAEYFLGEKAMALHYGADLVRGGGFTDTPIHVDRASHYLITDHQMDQQVQRLYSPRFVGADGSQVNRYVFKFPEGML